MKEEYELHILSQVKTSRKQESAALDNLLTEGVKI
jgi:hypothetical protein